FRDADESVEIDIWRWHHPKARLRDNSQVRLKKDLFGIRAVSLWIHMPGIAGLWESTHPRTQYFPVRKDDFQTAYRTRMVSIFGVSVTMICCIADKTPPAQIWRINHDLFASFLYFVVETVV